MKKKINNKKYTTEDFIYLNSKDKETNGPSSNSKSSNQ